MSPKISETDLILNPDGSVYHLNLLPKHVSDTVITVGDPDRVGSVSKYFDAVDVEIRKREFVTHVGRLNGQKIMVISTGMGTDNVEIFFTELDALVNVDLRTRKSKKVKKKLKVIRIGTSGSLQKDIPLDSHVVTDYAVGLDTLMQFYNLEMDTFERKTALGLKRKNNLSFTPYVVRGSESLLSKIGNDMLIGNTVTTPGFYAPQGRTVRLTPKDPTLLQSLADYSNQTRGFRLTNFEMETAGYYSLARLLGHEALSVSAIVANRVEKKFSKKPAAIIDDLIQKVLQRI
ncbi:MAG TPA: nucleoside phosphorylase [Chryseolinea sp.]|nr:nucleoside phosphorylase [Chryseolinea sp.]